MPRRSGRQNLTNNTVHRCWDVYVRSSLQLVTECAKERDCPGNMGLKSLRKLRGLPLYSGIDPVFVGQLKLGVIICQHFKGDGAELLEVRWCDAVARDIPGLILR